MNEITYEGMIERANEATDHITIGIYWSWYWHFTHTFEPPFTRGRVELSRALVEAHRRVARDERIAAIAAIGPE